jgi:hypothetical protein
VTLIGQEAKRGGKRCFKISGACEQRWSEKGGMAVTQRILKGRVPRRARWRGGARLDAPSGGGGGGPTEETWPAEMRE